VIITLHTGLGIKVQALFVNEILQVFFVMTEYAFHFVFTTGVDWCDFFQCEEKAMIRSILRNTRNNQVLFTSFLQVNCQF